jgi:hypothetical protein
MSKYYLESDNYETPEWAIKELFKSLQVKDGEKIWSPFRGDTGNNIKFMRKLNLDLAENKSVDFFDYQPDSWDILVDNPPFSIKNKIVRRALELGKPAILILPLLCSRNKWIKNLLTEFNASLTLAMPSKRINFEVKGKPTFWATFETAWFCFNCQDRFWGKSGVIHL